ncbi:MAG: hypothetical protein AB1710_02810 [Pseudomonadota bacterium]|jgi:hypothetical protein
MVGDMLGVRVIMVSSNTSIIMITTMAMMITTVVIIGVMMVRDCQRAKPRV